MDLARRFRQWQTDGAAPAPEKSAVLPAVPRGMTPIQTPYGTAYTLIPRPGPRDPIRLPQESLSELCHIAGQSLEPGLSWDDVAFFDLETTGLGGSGTVAFLAGIGLFEDGQWQVRQYFLTHLDGEPALLWAVARDLSHRPVLATFNGKSFDWQVLMSRWIQNRFPVPPPPRTHLDILHPVRRLYGRVLNSCGLASLEEALLGFYRLDDVPGSQIPSLYFSYLDSGDPLPMEPVLEHNRLDLESTALVAQRLLRVARSSPSTGGIEDLLAWARMWKERGHLERAHECLCSLVEQYEPGTSRGYRARVELGLVLKSQRRFSEAALVFSQALTPGDPLRGITPRLELAKHYEHRAGDFARALALTRQCLAILRRRRALSGTASPLYDQLVYRQNRLLGRLARS